MVANWSTLAQLYYSGAYNQLPSRVAPSPGVQLERGVSDDLDLKPSICTFRLWDDDDLLRPSNAASAISGQTGPYMRGAFATGSSVRFAGETQSMSPGQTDDHRAVNGQTVRGRRWVDVRLSGPLGRVGQWRDTVTSALTTQIQTYGSNLRGHWPLDDGRNSTQLTNLSHSNRPGRGTGLSYGAEGPTGATTAVEVQSGGTLSFPYAPMSTSAGWQLAFPARIANADATLRDVFTWRTTSGSVWRWRVSTSTYGLRVEDAAGTAVVDDVYLHGAGATPGRWITTRVKVWIVGSNVNIESSWYANDGEFIYSIGQTFAGTAGAMGAPTSGGVPANVATTGSRWAGVFALTGIADNLSSADFISAYNGYRGEGTVDRFTRLLDGRGVPYVVRGTSSTPMGAQSATTVQDQLKEIRLTEGGLIFDRANTQGIVLATRSYLYDEAAAPVLDLVWPDDFTGQLAESDPSADLANYVTASNLTGSSFTAELTTGRRGTQNPPTGAGRVDAKVEVNLATDNALDDVAWWWLRFRTQDGPRFDSASVDADLRPSLLTALNTAEPGQFMRITGRTPDPLLCLILSTSQATHRKRNVFTFKLAPGDVFRVGVYDDAGSRYDSGSTTLAAAATSTATSLSLATTVYEERWSTTAVPYPLTIAGERVTVTAMGAASYASGAWRQTATVTRSVNGVVKAQTSGTPVRLYNAVHYG